MNAATKEQILSEAAAARALEIITTTNSAPEIIAAARPYLHRPDIMQAAHTALATFWPGFFSCSNALRRALQEIETATALAISPLRLVPTTREAMQDGSAYLAATFGLAGVVAAVFQGTAGKDKAAQYSHVFRIEPVQP